MVRGLITKWLTMPWMIHTELSEIERMGGIVDDYQVRDDHIEARLVDMSPEDAERLGWDVVDASSWMLLICKPTDKLERVS